MDSAMVTVPRQLKTRPGAPQTHLAYITDSEADLLKEYKPDTPHEGAAGIPNYDTWGIDTTGTITGGSTADGGGAWSGDVGGTQDEPEPWSGSGNVVDTSGNGNGVNDINNIIGTEVVPEIPGQTLTEKDKVWELATQAYLSNPGYALSFEGKKFSDDLEAAGYAKGSKEHQDAMIQAFGMPNIVATGARTGAEIYTEKRTDEFGHELGGDYIYSGLGKALMDQYDQPGSYEDKTGDYWAERTEQERFEDQQQQHGYGYGYDPGGGGGGGGSWMDVKSFSRGRPENISPWARNIAGTPMLPVAGSGAGASMASADELYALASGKKAFSMTPEEQGILALLNA